MHDTSTTYRPSGEAKGRDGGRSGSSQEQAASAARRRSLIEASSVGQRDYHHRQQPQQAGDNDEQEMSVPERRRHVHRTLSLRQPERPRSRSRDAEGGDATLLASRRSSSSTLVSDGERRSVSPRPPLEAGGDGGGTEDSDRTPVSSPQTAARQRCRQKTTAERPRDEHQLGMPASHCHGQRSGVRPSPAPLSITTSEYDQHADQLASAPGVTSPRPDDFCRPLSTLLSPSSLASDHRLSPGPLSPHDDYFRDYNSPLSSHFSYRTSSPFSRNSERSVQSALADIRQKRELRAPQSQADALEMDPELAMENVLEAADQVPAGLKGGAEAAALDGKCLETTVKYPQDATAESGAADGEATRREKSQERSVFDGISRKTAKLLNFDRAKSNVHEETKSPCDKKADIDDTKEKKTSLTQKLSRIPSLIRRAGSRSEVKADDEPSEAKTPAIRQKVRPANFSLPDGGSVEHQAPCPINPDLLRGAFSQYSASDQPLPSSPTSPRTPSCRVSLRDFEDRSEPRSLTLEQPRETSLEQRSSNVRSAVDMLQQSGSNEAASSASAVNPQAFRNIAGQVIQLAPAVANEQRGSGQQQQQQRRSPGKHQKVSCRSGSRERRSRSHRSTSRERSAGERAEGPTTKKKSRLARLCMDGATVSSEENLAAVNGAANGQHETADLATFAVLSVPHHASDSSQRQRFHNSEARREPNITKRANSCTSDAGSAGAQNGIDPEMAAAMRRRLGRPLSTDTDINSEATDTGSEATAADDDEDSVSDRILRKSYFSRFNDRRRDRRERSASREVLSLIYDDMPTTATAESRRSGRRARGERRDRDSAGRSESLRGDDGRLRSSSRDPADVRSDGGRYSSTLPRRIKLAGSGDKVEPADQAGCKETLSSSSVGLRSSHESLPSDASSGDARTAARLARIEESGSCERAARRRTGDAPYFRAATVQIPSTAELYRRHTTALGPADTAGDGPAPPYRRTATSRLSVLGDQLKRNFDSVTSNIESLKEARKSRYAAVAAAGDPSPLLRYTRKNNC